MSRKNYDWQLPQEIEQRLGEESYGRQRAVFEAKHLLLILHTPPESESSERDCVLFLRTPDGKYLCNGNDGGRLRLRSLLKSYSEIYGKYDAMYDESGCAADLFNLMRSLLPLNRATTNLYNALQSGRDNVKGDFFLIAMRDEAYEISRNFELLLGDARLKLSHCVAENAEVQSAKTDEMALAQHKLNILVALTFPLMAITTVIGMNLVGGFETQPPVYWIVIGLSVFVGLAVKAWVTKK